MVEVSENIVDEEVETQEETPADAPETAEAPDDGDDHKPTTVDSLFGSRKEAIAEVEEATEKEPTEDPPEPEAPAEPVVEPEKVAANADLDAIAKERDGFKAAMFEERKKRQELEANQKAEPEDEESYVDADTKSYVDKKLAEKDNEIVLIKLRMSQQMARNQYADYEEVVSYFTEAANENPKLLDAAVATDNPAVFAYQEGQKLQFAKQYGNNPAAIREAMKKELRDEIRKEAQSELMGKVKAKSKQPTNLSKMRAAGGDSEGDWAPTSTRDIFG